MQSADTPAETLSPDEAFAVLGDETRLSMLQVLSESGEAMSFTELREAVGLAQGSQFNYHLDKLTGHFVANTDDGYLLRQPGRRVIEAVLSGAVTDDPVLEPSPVDVDCRLCGSAIQISYRAERVELYCVGCSGQYGERVAERPSSFSDAGSYLGGYGIPPAGLAGRSPAELLAASSLWTHLEGVALANELCPRCGAVVDNSVTVCEAHTTEAGLCSTCDNRHAVQVRRVCRNCGFTRRGMAINILAATRELRQFVAAQGIDPIVEGYKWGWDCAEDVHSVEPFRADFTFEVAGAEIVLHTGPGLEVLEVSRG